MTQLFVVHSAYGLTTAVAAIDEGIIARRGRRVLAVANTALVPETSTGPGDAAHVRPLLSRFDDVVSVNDLLAPIPPTQWAPTAEDLPMIERLLRRVWRLDDGPLELFLQSIHVAPALTFARLFSDATITVVSDGLMTFSPVRKRLGHDLTRRVTRVVYGDVVPGVAPLLFAEHGAERMPIPAAALGRVFEEGAAVLNDPALDALAADAAPTALILGQYLSTLGIVTPSEEQRLHAALLDRTRDWRPDRIVFKPHPSAPVADVDALQEHAERRGVRFEVYEGDAPAEIVAGRLNTIVAAALFSTALPTIAAVHGVPITAVETDLLLRRLPQPENSNRMPLALVDALTRIDSPYAPPPAAASTERQLLADAVGYAMQPVIMSHLRPRAEEFLSRFGPGEGARYLTAVRMTALELPGAPARSRLAQRFFPIGGAGRLEQARLTIKGMRRRGRRIWRTARGE